MIDKHICFYEDLHKQIQSLREELKAFPFDLNNTKQLRAGMDAAHHTECLLIDCENLVRSLVKVKNGG
jgi:hypothetical protein